MRAAPGARSAYHVAVDLAPIAMSVNVNCSTGFAVLVLDPRLEQEPGRALEPELLPVAQAVLGLEDPGLHVEAGDAIGLGLAQLVVFGQDLLLLRRQRRKRIAKRPRLDANDLGIRVVAAHLAIAADHFARRALEVDELLEFLAALVPVHEPRRLDAARVLVDERAGVIEGARPRGRASEQRAASWIAAPRDRRPRTSDRGQEDRSAAVAPVRGTRRADSMTAMSGHGLLDGAGLRPRHRPIPAAAGRRPGPIPSIGAVGEYSRCASR